MLYMMQSVRVRDRCAAKATCMPKLPRLQWALPMQGSNCRPGSGLEMLAPKVNPVADRCANGSRPVLIEFACPTVSRCRQQWVVLRWFGRGWGLGVTFPHGHRPTFLSGS